MSDAAQDPGAGMAASLAGTGATVGVPVGTPGGATVGVPANAPVDAPFDALGRFDAAAALHRARRDGLPRAEALALLAWLSGQPRSWLIAHDDVDLGGGVAVRWAELSARRRGGEPLAYLVGGREFHGLWLQVTAAVLDPRPDTETLVDWAVELLQAPASRQARVLDMGTGSGAIALAIKHAVPAADVTAVDISHAALDLARANGQRLGLQVQWLQGNWWQALGPAGAPPAADGRFDLIVSNPPYIAAHDPHLPALQHEPELALVSGPDGQDALRVLIAQASAWLRPGGWLLLEHGYDQSGVVAALFETPPRSGGRWIDLGHRKDLGGHVRCTGARWSTPGFDQGQDKNQSLRPAKCQE
jgi:release factor glutamine methyltransferase